MGKRSDFERIPRDFYPTPPEAVSPLIPFLRRDGIRTFAEPCCGDGRLVRHIESFGPRCVYQGDIATGQDALARDSYGGAQAAITNPPFTRKILHALIWHLARILPTWMLLPTDWASNKENAKFIPMCSDIVPVGRVKWIEDSEWGSIDNFAWYRFDIRHTAGPIFHPRGAVPARPSRIALCGQCGKPYQPQRANSLVCSNACRQRAYRRRLNVTQV